MAPDLTTTNMLLGILAAVAVLEALGVTAEAHLVRNDEGRYRVNRIDVTMAPSLPAADLERFERCRHIFEDFCIVTESVRRGVEVQVVFAGEAPALREAS